MGNQAGKVKGEAGDYDPAATGSDGKSKKGMFGAARTVLSSSAAGVVSSQPIEFGAAGASTNEIRTTLPSTSPGSAAMPVPSPKNIPIGVPMAAGKAVPYKRPKGSIEWDSEEEEDAAAARKSKNGNKDKVQLVDFEVRCMTCITCI